MGYKRVKYDKKDQKSGAAKKDKSKYVKPQAPKSKAFVCFLVDGPSEVKAFSSQFEELFDMIGGDNVNVEFRKMIRSKKHDDVYVAPDGRILPKDGGDITALVEGKIKADPDNIEKLIYEYYFKRQDQASGLGWQDLTTIIHIIDMDGVYVKDDMIREFTPEDEKLEAELRSGNREKPKNTIYYDDCIAVRAGEETKEYSFREKLCMRNAQKRKNIEHLLSLNGKLTAHGKIVNYHLYYFSANLDHFLTGDANLPADLKLRNADDFQRGNGDAEEMCRFFRTSIYAVNRKLATLGLDTDQKYAESWKAFRKGGGAASLEQGTNVDLLIEKIENSTLEDWL